MNTFVFSCPTPNSPHIDELTHWGRVTHICVGKLTIIGSDNGLSPGRRQTIIWTNPGILLIRPLGANFSEIIIGIQTFSFMKMYLIMSSAKWPPFCLGLNVLNYCGLEMAYGITDLCSHWLRQWLVAWGHQAITSTDAGLLSISYPGTWFNKLLFLTGTFLFTEKHLKVLSAKCQPLCFIP